MKPLAKLVVCVLSGFSLCVFAELESGGDVPFFKFSCLFSPTLKDVPFNVVFKNDDTKESYQWDSPFGRSRVIFDKLDKKSALISIATLPGTGILPTTIVPEEFKFISPITTGRIHFTTSLKPIREVKSASLSCIKAAEVEEGDE